MSTYAIGDVQGCFEPLERLLAAIKFNPTQDELWFAGDLVNRGPQSLEVLRFIKALPHKKVVLGNHDLHLLALYYTKASAKKHDTLEAILHAPDADELMHWLRQQPLVIATDNQSWCMSHAGIPPMWSVSTAVQLAGEVQEVLSGDQYLDFLQVIYGNHPHQWQASLSGHDRLRAIVNYLTRMRFIGPNNELDLLSKEGLGTAPAGFIPWFKHPERQAKDNGLLFGHWAALEGKTDTANVYALDTGCVWGGQLSALCLETLVWTRVAAAV